MRHEPAVPLPDGERVEPSPPDEGEVRTLARGLIGVIAPAGGPTPLQDVLVTAFCRSMTGFAFDVHGLDPLEPRDFATIFRHRDPELRTRIAEILLLGELILVPVPPEVRERVALVATLLGVEDGLVEAAERHAAGGLGLALVDFERNGYTAEWDGTREPLYTKEALDRAWELSVDDPALAERWAALEHCAGGTLGRGVFDFYRSRGFVFPGLPGSAPPSLCQHDWVHVAADYGSTVESEIEVFGLIARADPDPQRFALLAMVIGLFETGHVQRGVGLFRADRGGLPKHGMVERLADAMRRGARCGRELMAVDWFELADEPLPEVRSVLGIVPKADAARSAGSVGPWDPGGISAYQRRAGQAAAAAAGRPYDTGHTSGGAWSAAEKRT